MKQLAQKLADGRPVVVDVPAPLLGDGMILVQNYYSVVSAGTEGATVRSARKNLIAKALDRPKDVKATLELMKCQGPVQAYRAVMKKLDAYSPLGYSSAGRVIDVAPGVSGFAVGDYVACAGVGYASHAEIVAVPVNLCVKLRPDADLRAAAYNALGAIALQGVRQADLKLGEKCAVVGLGIVGALACQLLEASGVETFGIDLDPRAVEKARELGFNAQLRQTPGLENEALNVANGIGFDAVIIAAATSSLDPINLAGKLLRKKGRVVVLGDVPTGFDRNPDFYPKELELRMSCSYGAGRYDLDYEEKGIDYPVGYVRWTENRNMQAFQELAYKGKIAVDSLTTHVFSLDDAPQAYDMILKRAEHFLGVLIKYDESKTPKRVDVNLRASSPVDAHKGKIGYAFVGAGSYAQGSLLPNMPQGDLCEPIAILTKSGVSALRVAEKFHFQRVAKDIDDVLDDPNVDLVMIATRHDLHAKLLMRALKKKKRVFVEKPLCLTLDEFLEIRSLFASLSAKTAPKIMLGFNRRFSPYSRYLKEALNPNLPMAINYRVNAGAIPLNSWIQDP
ncbi:MAG: bi-domain-containing oxidoreductase, partial [Thermoguttaceae bacterium]